MHEDSENLISLLETGTLCICGNTKMGMEVTALVKNMLGEDKFKLMEK